MLFGVTVYGSLMIHEPPLPPAPASSSILAPPPPPPPPQAVTQIFVTPAGTVNVPFSVKVCVPCA
nr:MAG TPA: hypothetical protein [Caudoviricetes sp.]